MKAAIDGRVVADAPESDLILIEGNYYFPPSSLRADAFSDSPTPYTCPWKGVAQYDDISVARPCPPRRGVELPDPYPASFARVGQDYSAMSPSTSGRSRWPNSRDVSGPGAAPGNQGTSYVRAG